MASPSSQRAWIEINRLAYSKRAVTSPSSQRAWIEMLLLGHVLGSLVVALLAEGVDRNRIRGEEDSLGEVALLAEGVDRNSVVLSMSTMHSQSPSSQRAWIEIAGSVGFPRHADRRPPRRGRG